MEFLEEASEIREAQSFDKIAPGTYEVQEFKFFETKYGPRIIAVTQDFEVFLPPRFSVKANTQEHVDRMNADNVAHTRVMIYEGKDEKAGNRVNVRFEKMKGRNVNKK